MKKSIRVISVLLLVVVMISGCGVENTKKIKIQVFIAASLSEAMEEVKDLYELKNPAVTITYNADSSGTLLTQIEEGYACDIFFSADTKQIVKLEEEKMIISGSRTDLLKNQVVLITSKGSNTKVTGFNNMDLASSMALADGSVPVGKYTRNILMKLEILPETQDISTITTNQVKEALGGIEINECSNVSKVKEAVKETSNEIGCVYYSDAYSIKDDVDMIAIASTELTGDIIYPVTQIINEEAGETQLAAATDFMEYLKSEEAKNIFEKYMFLINE